MKYLLFVYPCEEIWDEKETNIDIASELSKISLSDNVKYLYGDNNSIFHFDSDLSPSEVTDFLDLVLYESEEFMYILLEGYKNIESNMPPENLEGLLKLNKKNKKNKEKNYFSGRKNFFDIRSILEKNNREIFKILENEICDLTIDEILDKIIDQGIDSLTKAEKNKLDEYSKGKI